MSLLVAGVDEAGRGPLAGPVAVAAVILREGHALDGLDDSKRLTEARREALYPQIIASALAWRVEFVECDEIDRLNILQATLAGMCRALRALSPAAQLARIDGNQMPRDLPCPAETVVGGDGLEPAIMAASILAKVSRDRLMRELHLKYPQYGFDRHKGYASREHLAALEAHGPCPAHRRSFMPVQMSLTLDRPVPG
ncbi:MAG: ribonuclease HII [Gammaproteobacteria bacterium]|uniref:ribonuclease HII n=1 Tax=Luteimonas sp. JM171 TaxID=1896164 RepID=UPI00085658A0|nr:ribonuclease HII [Luteimonas sp. JM171]AOH37282.1 ribonuclease HII [Luteimonas sp. JM171]NLC60501.1 ribonuclease HII [Gammaproteobacteria bacterium]